MNNENTAEALIRRNINVLAEALESGLLHSRLGDIRTFMYLTDAKRAWQSLLPLINQGIGQSRPIDESKPTVKEVE